MRRCSAPITRQSQPSNEPRHDYGAKTRRENQAGRQPAFCPTARIDSAIVQGHNVDVSSYLALATVPVPGRVRHTIEDSEAVRTVSQRSVAELSFSDVTKEIVMRQHFRIAVGRSAVFAALLLGVGVAVTAVAADDPPDHEALWQQLKQYFTPPAQYVGKFGPYRSPLRFADGTMAKTPQDWARRRQEILALWQHRLGAWPPLLERPTVTRLESVQRDGYVQYHVHVQVSPDGKIADGYLLVPDRSVRMPAVLVPFYEPLTSIGQGKVGHGTHDYGLQLVRRGFVTLSIGTPGSLDTTGSDTRKVLTKAGIAERRQPLGMLAYVAANCHTALAQMPEVDPSRIGIIGLSYGGKWAMFASCLYDKFACAVWSDPGIVFNEKDTNVNYYEPWYLGYDPNEQRKPGVPSATNPRTGLYKELVEAGDDLVDLEALMAPRPVLVSGGIQDPPRNWVALNHLIAVNDVLGQKDRVAMTARPTHRPTPAALKIEIMFLEYWLQP